MREHRPELPLTEAGRLTARDEPRRARQIETAMRTNPHRGRPLRARAGAGRPSVEAYANAALGAPRWVERMQEIETHEQVHRERLAAEWEALRRTGGAGFAQAWRAAARAWDFGEVNRLIEQHNAWYPIERDLPIDMRTRDYVTPFGIPFRRRRLDADWILERFPVEAGAAPHRGEQAAAG